MYKYLDFFDAGIKDIITAVFRYQTSHGLALMLIYINKNYIFCVPLAHEKLPWHLKHVFQAKLLLKWKYCYFELSVVDVLCSRWENACDHRTGKTWIFKKQNNKIINFLKRPIISFCKSWILGKLKPISVYTDRGFYHSWRRNITEKKTCGLDDFYMTSNRYFFQVASSVSF